MANYMLAYTGGGAPDASPEELQKIMDAWMGWFGTLGESVVDAGNPFGPSSTIASDGSVSPGGAAALGGYSIISAESLDAATDKAKGCPILAGGGGVEVYEVVPMG